MGMMKLEIPHSLSVEEAKKRVEVLFAYWGKKYGITSSWVGDTAKFAGKAMGISISGNLAIAPKVLGGEASDPGFLFRGKAKDYLNNKFAHYLNPSKTIEELQKSDD